MRNKTQNHLVIIGHKTPDTDTIASSIVYADFKNKTGEKASSFLTGKLNKETDFILNFLKIEKPKTIKNIADKNVVLMDHGNLIESVEGIEKANVIEVIDHHKMSGINTDAPIFYRAEPIGSASSIVAKIFKEKGIKINKKQAGLLLCGIISDTLKLTSPTTTDDDKKLSKELAKIANININDLAKKMFEAKSDISGESMEKIIETDYKEFNAGKIKFGFGVHETTCPDSINEKKDKIIMALIKKKTADKPDFMFFAVVDIIKQKSYLYLINEEERLIARKAFKADIKNDIAILDKVVSRKKQMVPPLLKLFSKNR